MLLESELEFAFVGFRGGVLRGERGIVLAEVVDHGRTTSEVIRNSDFELLTNSPTRMTQHGTSDLTTSCNSHFGV